jgi:glycogen operon protein
MNALAQPLLLAQAEGPSALPRWTLLPGKAHPFGAHVVDGGVNFAVFSEHAEAIELCLFDAAGAHELRRYALHGPTDGVFHGRLAGAGAGLVYGLRAHGRYAPEAGLRFNPHKLLLDPCAREIVGHFEWLAEQHGYTPGHPDGSRSFDTRDNAPHALKARVAAADSPAPGAANRPGHPSGELVLYEVHVKGFSKLLPGVPEALRGTYAGLAQPQSIAHLKALGVTTLSLLPVQYGLDEAHLARRGLRNYWGYNTIGYFSPDPRLGSRPDDPSALREEFREMVATLHAHGLEVLIDVVFNHTAEGSELGPTLSFRGLDNASWYWLMADDPSRCENYSHCGNTLRLAHPRVCQFVLDTLRYWVEVMGVDGFRFDLAPLLGRTRRGFDPDSPLLVALRQDPVLAGARLIAEPWDGGPDGYQLGRFPARFLEWNDRFRDAARGYWLRRGVSRGEFARRWCASSDLFQHGRRLPSASVNFITAHDGYTLADLVSHSRKHNEINGEGNRDGREHELCDNFGVEGASEDPVIREIRRRVRRALLATLLLAQGTPMLLAGDELCNGQRGNNNAYCQDNPLGWLDWPAADRASIDYVARLIALRRAEPMLRHERWFRPQPGAHCAAGLLWLSPDGAPMQPGDWNDTRGLAFACGLRPTDPRRHQLLLLFNPDPVATRFELGRERWQLLLDSSAADTAAVAASESAEIQHALLAPAHSLLLLRSLTPTGISA